MEGYRLVTRNQGPGEISEAMNSDGDQVQRVILSVPG